MLHQSVQSRIHFVKAHDIVLDWLKWLDISFADVLVLGKCSILKVGIDHCSLALRGS